MLRVTCNMCLPEHHREPHLWDTGAQAQHQRHDDLEVAKKPKWNRWREQHVLCTQPGGSQAQHWEQWLAP